MCSGNVDLYLGYQADGKEKEIIRETPGTESISRDSKPYDRSKSWSSDCHDPKQSTQLITVDGDERADPSRCLVTDRSCERDVPIVLDRLDHTAWSPRGETILFSKYSSYFRSGECVSFNLNPSNPPHACPRWEAESVYLALNRKKDDNCAKDRWNCDL